MSFAPSHTYAANPLASAAGLAAVTLFREGGFPDRIRALAAYTEPACATPSEHAARCAPSGSCTG